MHFERATLLYDFAVIGGQPRTATPLTVLTKDGKVRQPAIDSSDPVDAFASELTEAVKTVSRGKPSALLDGQLARDAVVLCRKQTDSLLKGRIVAV
jgi:hypothetical protein